MRHTLSNATSNLLRTTNLNNKVFKAATNAARILGTMTATANVTRTPVKVVYARETPEGMGATVRRSIGSPALRNLSPFLMLDAMQISPSDGAGFPDHPHRGQTTVTYVTGGALHHEDSKGNTGTLRPGDVQWMQAAKGIVHSEMPLFDDVNPVPAEGLQLWIDLPASEKMEEPTYQERKAADIESAHPAPGVDVTVISGEAHGVTGFVRCTGAWFLDYKLTQPGASVFQPLPEGWTAFAYVMTGALQVGEEATAVVKHNTVVLSAEDGQTGVLLTRPEDATDVETRFVLIAGKPLDQPVVQAGPFVVTSRQEAMQAFMDFQLGQNGFEGAPGWESKIGAPLRRAHSRG